jgi:ribonuclease VapC
MQKPEGLAESSAHFAKAEPTAQGNLGADGRLMIPASIRDAAGIKRGDKVTLRVEDGRIVVESWRSTIKRIQDMLAHLKVPGESVVDEFLAERRAMWGEIFMDLAEDFAISSVNLGEVATKLAERGYADADVRAVVGPVRESCHPLTVEQSIKAGLLRKQTRHLGLSMGDRCCLALALDLVAEVWTTERKWAALDLGIKIRVIR